MLTMRAVWYDRLAPAREVLVAGELATPEPGHYEVRVRLEAAGVNPSDTYWRRRPVPAMEYPASSPEATAPVSWTRSARWWRIVGSANGCGCTTASAMAAAWVPRP